MFCEVIFAVFGPRDRHASGGEDLVNAWAYAQLHPSEIDQLIDAHEAA